MQPADIRVDPWVWLPGQRRKSRIVPLILVGCVCLAIGYVVGRKPDGGGTAPPPTAASTKLAGAGTDEKTSTSRNVPTARPNSVRVPERDASADSAVRAQSQPQPPRVVLLNPGTAAKSKEGHSAGVAEPKPARVPRFAYDAPRKGVDIGRNSEGEGGQVRDYHQLRQYMLGR
jgi:hypothetical protein